MKIFLKTVINNEYSKNTTSAHVDFSRIEMPKRNSNTGIYSFTDFLPRRVFVLAATVKQLVHLTYAYYFGLTEAQFRIIGRLKNVGPSTQQEISETTSMDKMAVSRAARALAKRGVISRTPSDDGRAHLLNLTDEGIALSVQLEARSVELETALLDGWTDAEVARFRSDLERLNNRAKQQIQLAAPASRADPGVPKIRRAR